MFESESISPVEETTRNGGGAVTRREGMGGHVQAHRLPKADPDDGGRDFIYGRKRFFIDDLDD